MSARFIRPSSFHYFIVVFFVITSVLSKFLYHGLIYGFDFGLFHPDGTLYTFRTLTFMGYSQHEAGNLIAEWYQNHASKMTHFSGSNLYFENNPNWVFYKSRVLYPILSVPFVFLFGINGMLVIPTVSFIVLMITIYKIGKSKGLEFLALILIFLLSNSLTVVRWMFVNTTDSLFTALSGLLTYAFLKVTNKSSWYISCALIIVLMSLTRLSLFVVIPFCILLFKVHKTFSLGLTLTGIVTSFQIFQTNNSTLLSSNLSSGSYFDKSLELCKNLVKVSVTEFGQLFILDRVLFAVLLFALIVSLLNLKSDSSQFFVLTFTFLIVMGGLNGTLGVNFRYQLPVLASMSWVIFDFVATAKQQNFFIWRESRS